MIISKYSGNIIGYLDYFAADGKRINPMINIASVRKLKCENYQPDNSEMAYVRFCRRNQVKFNETVKQVAAVRKRLQVNSPLSIYSFKGNYIPHYEIGEFVDIVI